LDYYGYFYVSGRYFHASNLGSWREVSKPVRGSTAKHKGKAQPVFTFVEGRAEVRGGMGLSRGVCIGRGPWILRSSQSHLDRGRCLTNSVFTSMNCWQVTLTLDLKENTLRFAHCGRNLGIITDVRGPLHAALTLTSSRQKVGVRA
jgi:hypothetical protein